MTAALLLSSLLATAQPEAASPAQRFAEGVAARSNAATARSLFADAARQFDARWAADGAFPRSPALALARSRSHALADHRPHALAAVHDGLALAPFDLELQADLLALRGKITYPEGEPATRVRPDDPRGWRDRVTPWDVFFAAAAFGLVTAVGVFKLFTTRPPWAKLAIAGGGVGLLLCGAVAARIAEVPRRPVVVTADAVLRRGNGPSFPPRMPTALPRGAEVFEVGRRGGWVQVELPGGATGWLPETQVLR